MENTISLSLILPVYNEELNINDVIVSSENFLNKNEIIKVYEIIVVDDGSTDKTADILESLRLKIRNLKVLRHNENLGYGAAILSGVQNAEYSWCLIMDADGQVSISSLNNALHYTKENDIIVGYRYKRDDPIIRIILGKLFSSLMNLLFHLNLRDVNCGFKLFRKKCLNINGFTCHSGAFYTHILLNAMKRGYLIKEFPIEHVSRKQGKQSGASLKVVCKSIIDVIRIKLSKME